MLKNDSILRNRLHLILYWKEKQLGRLFLIPKKEHIFRHIHLCQRSEIYDRYDNVEPDEDGIGIVKNKDDNYGVEIYESEIESIEIVT